MNIIPMNVYRVHYLYHRANKSRAVKGDTKVIAESPEQAQEAFAATHPDGAAFHYVITEVEAIALSELF